MLGRGRMRRGVSLEVIVEEDDSAEVMLDPTPIMENDDEGHDEDDEDDSENGGSTPGSPSGSGGGSSGGAGGRSGGGGGGAGGRSSSGAEERRKKRERRRTIGGLSRVRSVSCEALTLLDTSDMDSCCSEWDDDDDMSTGSSNYVTLNRPISRRRILESTQSQCDSEDSGIEYQSNEDDPALEDQSSIEDRKDVDQSSVDIHEQETATESDDDDADAASEPLHNPSRSADDDAASSGANAATEMGSNVDDDANITMDADAETIMDASADADEGTSANVVESSGASTYEDADVGFDTIADADTGITSDADHDAITEANTEANTEMSTDANADADIPKHDAKAGADSATNTDAAGEDVLLSAKTGKHLFEERSKQGGGHDHTTTTTTAKYLQDYTANEVLENDKLVIVETTPPVPTKRPAASQRPVDAAEEELRLKRAAYTIRNKEVQLEELPRPHTVRSVKQLFEDLKTPVRHFHAWRDLGRFRDIKSNPSSKILRFDRSDSIEAAGPGCLGVGSSFTLPHFPRQQKSRASPHASEPSTLPKVSYKSQHQQEMATTKGGQSVMLRKPMVRGFNVKKALMEDPRTFHPSTRGNQPTANTRQQPTSSNKQTSSHHSRKNHVHFAKKSHHSSDATDRSDTESLASDISEDSGVSNDSNTSTASSGSISTYRAFDAYTSDPSFKWIDPAIMAKIRAVGTTVIFFGPRPRPRHHDGTVHRSVKSTPSGLQVSKGGIPTAGKTSNTTVRPAQKDVSRSSPVPAPRIVGVVRKRNPNTSGSTPRPTPVPTSTDPCSDHSRASTPGRCQ